MPSVWTASTPPSVSPRSRSPRTGATTSAPWPGRCTECASTPLGYPLSRSLPTTFPRGGQAAMSRPDSTTSPGPSAHSGRNGRPFSPVVLPAPDSPSSTSSRWPTHSSCCWRQVPASSYVVDSTVAGSTSSVSRRSHLQRPVSSTWWSPTSSRTLGFTRSTAPDTWPLCSSWYLVFR